MWCYKVLTVSLLALIHVDNPAIFRCVCSSTAEERAPFAMMRVSSANSLEVLWMESLNH